MGRRLGIHAVALAAVLLVLLAVTGTRSVVSADEGAMLAQLDVLERTGQWTLPNPEPEVDPELQWLPLELSERSLDGRWAPFAKHPVHVVLLRPFWEAGGLGGALVLSLAGVVGASVAAAAVAERLRPGAGPAVLWLAGTGSPLLFDGFQVVGHALGAATFGAAAVCALRATDASGRSSRGAWLAGVAIAVAATGLIRSEGVLAGLALGAGFGAAGLVARRRSAVLTGAVAAVTAVAVRVGEPVLLRLALGARSAGVDPSATVDDGFLAARWSGFRITVLDAGYGIDGGEVFLLLALVLAAAAAGVWRIRRDPVLVQALMVAAAASAVLRAVSASFLVPGLLPALPLLAIGVVLARGADLRAWPASAVWATAAGFVALVVATQYGTGGTGEWGGRYYAVALPLLVALAAVAARSGIDDLPAGARRVAVGCFVVIVATIAVGAVRAADRARDSAGLAARAVIDEVDALAVDATVSTRGAVSRFAWEDVLDGRRWFSADPEELDDLLGRLAESDAERLALVTADPDAGTAAAAGAGWTPAERDEVRPGTTVVLLTR